MLPLAAIALALLFLGATLFADRDDRLRLLPLWLLCLASAAAFHQLARYDHGYHDVLVTIGWIGAPLIVIFGGAAWGTRKWYGWPDLGAHPGRAALLGIAITAGVMSGARAFEDDVERSRKLGNSAARRLSELVAGSASRKWPTTIEGLLPEDERTTHMGLIAKPPFVYGKNAAGRPILAIPVNAGAYVARELPEGAWRLQQRPPLGISEPIPYEEADSASGGGTGDAREAGG